MEYSEASPLLRAVKHVCENLNFKLASFEDEEKNPLTFERRYVPVGTAWRAQYSDFPWSDGNAGSNRYTQNALRKWIMITGSKENMLRCGPIEQMDVGD